MKAIVQAKYGTKGVFNLNEVEKPVPGDDDVLVKVYATSINDWDWSLMTGKPYVIRLMFGLTTPKIKIPGVDIAGKVISVGKNIKQFQPGDEVFGDLSEYGFGGFAEYVCTSEIALSKKSPNMTFEEAAAMPHASMLAVQGLVDIGLIQSGQKVLINGAGGGVGTLGIQIAKEFNVDITGVDSNSKLEMIKSLGYDHVIDYDKKDFTKDQNTYDLILDAKINRSVFEYVRSLKKHGRYIVMGGSFSRILEVMLYAPLVSLFHNKVIKVLDLKPNKDLTYINKLFDEGKLKPVIEKTYYLEDIPDLIHFFADGKHKGKVVVTVAVD